MDDRLASIDLGSNTFRLSIGRVVRHGDAVQIYDEDRLRELVAMANGLDEHQKVNAATIEKALAALRRFGERLQGFDPANVRAVATNTFRIAHNAAEILPLAERALGFPIEIISGQEEARLIYLGVIQTLPPSDHRRLVIDIGGGSTEFIIGQGDEPLHLASLELGCTSWTRRFFPGGHITAARLQQAVLAAREAIETIAQRYRRTGWDEAYGSSGTAKGLLAILVENALDAHDITLTGMERLSAALVRSGEVRLSDWAGLKEERAPVLAGGLAIMMAAFQELGISHMGAGDGALRIGVLHDLLGRDFHHDQRDESIRQMAERYRVDTSQAGHVCEIALDLFDQLGLEQSAETKELRHVLRWAATLHEIGLAIARSDYHKHSAYILEHADLPGFSRDDQRQLGFLARGHQGRLGKVRTYAPDRAHWLALCCLRLAVLLMRGREAPDTQPVRLQAREHAICLKVPAAWLQAHPLSEYSLRAEAGIWPKAGFTMEIAAH
ncbi:MAG TPA: Ppx/GppA phosphatase family protein [Castellaniella sp.]|uniref:Ppx/GppA phosphatase family protein n=1 Tax=Castellaniella sp. TaxID=1955812 RepID=UPI002F095733